MRRSPAVRCPAASAVAPGVRESGAYLARSGGALGRTRLFRRRDGSGVPFEVGERVPCGPNYRPRIRPAQYLDLGKLSLYIYADNVLATHGDALRMSPHTPGGMSALDYHVLLAMARAPRYGYAIREAVEAESAGAVTPRPGSLYRVLARLMAEGLVDEAEHRDLEPHPGRARRYYGLTAAGRAALAAEASRLKDAAALAEERLGTAEGGA